MQDKRYKINIEKLISTGTYDANFNSFFAHLVKEISVTRYGNDKQLMPTFSSYETYRYSDSMLKHLPKNALKKLKKQCFIANSQSIWIEQL